ncbi:Cobyrinic acid ac-diamide synthase [Solidesulfovibrio carbinoliphilus subsp. oakridgensis]|uniref:Cobyrinic acid ac-diamide synthase n=1 Tax=Solidesulfovibrio carbinoliphilus subsp. oakridgensis TaxID=694327 RepID=G7QB58_9BACT|nr:conjugal transfer protein TraL [Solidesulfovibrio carbinoliphilus]EHJ48800.1 Cobyrinic acid ac-diamide synthase [Solidesulfovibrio carbinoliphilus subsp. oakridgensis]
MATIHFVLQGKGGVGKSFIASLLVQYYKLKEFIVHAIDTDPVNNTLAGYKEFDVSVLPIMKDTNIDARMFDSLMETALGLPDDAHLVIDNGASSFIPLCSYLLENDAINLLQAEGHTVVLHSIVTGGQGIQDTVNGLAALANHFPQANLVVWLNPKDGEIALDGLRFYDFKVYEDHGSQFHAVIELPNRNSTTFGKDLSDHLARRQSFEAAIHSSQPVMVRRRLAKYWDDVVTIMDTANLLLGRGA